MLLFTHLCVELQRSSFAKDGLYQYRNICKDASLHSFETVVKKFLGRAEDKANVARTESEQTASTLQDIEDLDYMQTPERWSCVVCEHGRGGGEIHRYGLELRKTAKRKLCWSYLEVSVYRSNGACVPCPLDGSNSV